MNSPITVLCFGDSNTHGTRPDVDDARFERSVRWTGQLQQFLGEKYYVIEEGLGGRTTNLEHPRTEKPGRDGLSYFRPCIESHSPLDFVVIMLGTNDFKNVYNRTAEQVAAVLSEYVAIVRELNASSKIILVSPSHITATEPIEYYDAQSEQKSKELSVAIEQVAKQEDAAFIDAGALVRTGEDGLHWDEPSQKIFAEYLANTLERVL